LSSNWLHTPRALKPEEQKKADSTPHLGGMISHRVNLGRFFERPLSGIGSDIHDGIVE
jgi:hypothetical protein